MDDTVAMQDTNERASNGPTAATKAAPSSSSSHADAALLLQVQPQQLEVQQQLQPAAVQLDQQLHQLQQQQLGGMDEQQLLLALGNPARPDTSPRSPQQQGQQAFDAASNASDGSQDLSGMRAHAAPRRNYSSVDVDAAKHAALSALAGLDMTTTRANLDASKAAAATARANGEIPTHVRKSNLRSVSCRQLGTSSSAVPGATGVPGAALLGTGATVVPGGVGKTVAFDDAASKARVADGSAVKTVQWRTGTTPLDASGQPRRPTRAPASRCISLPHVLQGRAGMASRLAASYAADPGLAQQFTLLDGSSNHTHPLVAPGLGHSGVTAGAMPQMDVLSMYQLQQAAAAAGGNQLLGQRAFGANSGMLGSTMDDSMLGQVRSSGLMLPGQHVHAQLQQQAQVQQLQQQQQQQQQAALAGNWSAAHQQQVAWASGAGQVPVAGGAALTNQQLLVQLQQQGATHGAAVAGGGAGNEALWLQAPAMSAAMQGAAGGAARPTGLMLSGGAGGQQGLASPHLQQAFGGAALGGASSSAGGGTFQALLDQYQQVSWALLAAAQTEGTIREQLLTELVLQLTMLHTLSGVLQSTLQPGDAITDFEYLGSAARRHMATFNRLSQAGDIAVQQLAMIAPLACRHLGSPELLDAAFLALDTLALANRDVAGVVVQQRLTALTSLTLQLPVEQLLQQQTLALAWINSMAAVVGRNKQLLESFATADVGGAGQPMVSAPPGAAALLQASGLGGGGMLAMGGGGGLASSSQPMMMSPTGTPGLSPTGKTPLATYFEENPQPASLVSPSGGGGVPAPAGAGAPGLAAAPGHLAAGVQPDALLPDGLGGLGLGGADPAAATLAGLSTLSLGTSPAQVPAAGAAAVPGAGSATAPGAGGLLGGLSLFGGPVSGSGSSQGGGPTGVVGVQ